MITSHELICYPAMRNKKGARDMRTPDINYQY